MDFREVEKPERVRHGSNGKLAQLRTILDQFLEANIKCARIEGYKAVCEEPDKFHCYFTHAVKYADDPEKYANIKLVVRTARRAVYLVRRDL